MSCTSSMLHGNHYQILALFSRIYQLTDVADVTVEGFLASIVEPLSLIFPAPLWVRLVYNGQVYAERECKDCEALLSCPLNVNDNEPGKLEIGSIEVDCPELDRQLFEITAHHLEIILSLLERQQKQQRQVAAMRNMAQVSEQLRLAENMRQLLPLIMYRLLAFSGADRCVVVLLKTKETFLFLKKEPEYALLNLDLAAEDEAFWRIIQSKQVVELVEDVDEFSFFSSSVRRKLFFDSQKVSFYPVQSGKENIGTICLGFCEDIQLSTFDKQMISATVAMTGNALMRFSLIADLERRIHERSRQISALYRVTAVASETNDRDTMLRQLLDEVLKAMHCLIGTIHLFDSENGKIELVVHQGFSDAVASQVESFVFSTELVPDVLKSQELLIHTDQKHNLLAPRGASSSRNPATYAGVPIQVGKQRLGVLSILAEQSKVFSSEDIGLLAAIGDQIGIMLENHRLHKQAERLAVLEERQRLSRELHDSVSQMLYSVTLFTEMARMMAKSGDEERLQQALDDMDEASFQALRELRLMVFELRPPDLREMNLIEAIQNRLDAVENRVKIETRLLVNAVPELPDAVEDMLFRIVQEALNNVLKHAAANKVVVRVSYDEEHEHVQLDIEDDGRGFDLEKALFRGGMGLKSIQERVDALGGQLFIQTTPGKGTKITIQIDLHFE